jgi:uncharacterized membrane protein YoaK (UPF0700 family)
VTPPLVRLGKLDLLVSDANMNSQSPRANAEWRLAGTLAVVAGYVDAFGLIALGTYVSFMSGNTTQTGAMIGLRKFAAALPSALAIVSFATGCFGGTWLTLSKGRNARRLLFGLAAAGLAAVIGGSHLVAIDQRAIIAVLSLAMGLLNSTLAQVGAEPVNLTFVTGTLSKIGRHLALAARRATLTDAQGPWDSHLYRATVLISIWAGFLAGAFLAAAAYSCVGVDALAAPFLVLLTLTFLNPQSQHVSR